MFVNTPPHTHTLPHVTIIIKGKWAINLRVGNIGGVQGRVT